MIKVYHTFAYDLQHNRTMLIFYLIFGNEFNS